MKRWKLWAAVASSLLSAGSIPTYYFWPRSSDIAIVDGAETKSTTDESPHASPPQPIPDTAPDFSSAQPQFVSPASFNAPTSEQPDPGDSGQRSTIPARSQFDAAAPASPVSLSNFNPNLPNADSSRYRTSFSDAQSPATDPPISDTEPPAPGLPAEPAPVEPQPEVSPSFGQPPASTDEPINPPTGEPGTSEAAPDAGEAAPDTVPPRAPGVLAPPKPMPLRPAVPESSPAETDVQTTPADQSTPPVEADPVPLNRFNPSRPAAPSLRPSPLRGMKERTSEPPATLPEKSEIAPTTRAPRTLSEIRTNPSDSRASRLVSATPGERKLEGLQAPSLTVERSAPEEIQVGKPAKFVIRVRNIGQVPAQDVVVTDQVPQGTRLLAATPEVSPSPDGTVAWELGAVLPGDEATLTLELMPEAEGEIGSVAEVTFRAQAAVRTIATKPLLKVEHSGPGKVLIGEEVPFQISISNPGTGIATGVVVEVDVPDGLAHDGGREIMSDRFDLRPNESRKIDLVLKAVEAGSIQSIVRAVADSGLKAQHTTQVEVVAPQLQIAIAGATRRFLDRPVKYQIGVNNPGTAPAQEIELIARLPRGLKFVAADKKGEYDQRQHAVLWSLEELPAGEQGVVELTAIPTDTGEQKLHVEGRGALSVEDKQEHTTVVDDITDLVFTVTDENVPIEVGSDTTYQIRVANNGTKVARNIRLAVQLPNGLEVIDLDGQIQQQADQLIMQPIAQLAQQEEAVFRIAVKGTKAGDHVVRVQLLSDEFTAPLTREEITKVYSDK